MPGLIAGCHRRSKNYEVAIKHYENAANKAQAHESKLDLAFALSDLLTVPINWEGMNNQMRQDPTAKIVSQMESKTLSHLNFEFKWLIDLDVSAEWAENIKSLLKSS